MIIVLSDKQKSDLSLLAEVPPQVVAEFFKLSLQFIRVGANRALFNSAAKQLSVDPLAIQSAVEALSSLLSQASKANLTDIDFVDSLISLSFDESQKELLKSLFIEHKNEIRAILQSIAFELPKYHNLDWRLDVKLATRSIRNLVEPVYVLRLETRDPEPIVKTLECDYNTLKYLCEELESALNQTKTVHVRRIMRNIK